MKDIFWSTSGKDGLCKICKVKCLIKPKTHPLTHQLEGNLSDPDLQIEYEITGPDTLLAEYRKARLKKDYERADEIKEIGKKMGMTPAYCKTHYEVHG